MIVGIDLSGPSNHKDTVMVMAEGNQDVLNIHKTIIGCSDRVILEELSHLDSGNFTVAIDAPLSYQDGGGDRTREKALRSLLKEAGLPVSSVMTPTMTRMVYVTLRGIQLASLIRSQFPGATVVEIHPGAVFGTRLQEDERFVAKEYKWSREHDDFIFSWLYEQGVRGLQWGESLQNHEIDAVFAAFGAWKYLNGDKKIEIPEEKPLHPFALWC